MGISDKARKILWSQSGGRCAICKRELVVGATPSDDEAIVGDECHLVSGKLDGPRHDPSFPRKKLNSHDNLILLCRNDHKEVDDQSETYTVAVLTQMRKSHETWVSQELSKNHKPAPLKLKRVKQNIPHLTRVTTGKQVLAFSEGAMAVDIDSDELRAEQEVGSVGDFFQNIQDLDLVDEPSDRVRQAFALTRAIEDLEELGFWVFGAREVQILECGTESVSDWPVAIIRVFRKDSPGIVSTGKGT